MSDQGRVVWLVEGPKGELHRGHDAYSAWKAAYSMRAYNPRGTPPTSLEEWARDRGRDGWTCTRMVPAAAFDRLVEAVRKMPCQCPIPVNAQTLRPLCWRCEALREAGVEK